MTNFIAIGKMDTRLPAGLLGGLFRKADPATAGRSYDIGAGSHRLSFPSHLAGSGNPFENIFIGIKNDDALIT